MKNTLLVLILGLASTAVLAQPGSRLWATGGVTTIEGSAGGGLVPMAVLAGYASDTEWGGTLALSHAPLDDYTVDVVAGAVNWHNRLELSVARQTLDLDTLGAALDEDHLQQDIFGAKIRLAGDVVYGSYGQWSLGVQHKRNRTFTVPEAVGANDDSGTDIYLAGSKLFLAGFLGRNVLVNGVVRGTKANQGGLLGFGGDELDRYEAVFEASAGLLLNRQWLLGGEYRQKPDNLSFAEEEDGYDLFVAWFPDRRLAVTAAWVNLGSIAGLDDQQGAYLSLQGAF
ncbi:DUF3034 family protein [Marinobacter nanhaiticus D15-8W]|uniref:DUF3034 family protein n=1 Tax=Marinobacter nanhaiticus D15-8W TaxID=626887 RepID=N6W523_9GAMM|nr:DUF3034 family protein [Marinobacter nanhaiticus]ENO15284.1 DUF3034 family protein [Marinobacter nanhaiticus D15-8W]BES69013.1 DUF3034 family protein [Marinobacter nanhaiticus D15-8W]